MLGNMAAGAHVGSSLSQSAQFIPYFACTIGRAEGSIGSISTQESIVIPFSPVLGSFKDMRLLRCFPISSAQSTLLLVRGTYV
jgi:hypothetical protein